MIDGDDCGAVSVTNLWQGKPKYSVETCPLALCPPYIQHDLTLSNPGRSGGKPATNHLSYDTAVASGWSYACANGREDESKRFHVLFMKRFSVLVIRNDYSMRNRTIGSEVL
jgi:hypothetical protein